MDKTREMGKMQKLQKCTIFPRIYHPDLIHCACGRENVPHSTFDCKVQVNVVRLRSAVDVAVDIDIYIAVWAMPDSFDTKLPQIGDARAAYV